MNIKIQNAGMQTVLNLPFGTTLGILKGEKYKETFQSLGAPSSYNLTVNGTSRDDEFRLSEGDTVSFRPVAGNKG